MRRIARGVALAATCAAAFGATGAWAGAKVYQADHRLPAFKDVDDDTERAEVKDAQTHHDRGNAASDSGNTDQARAEWKAAAEAYARIAQRHSGSEWRIVYHRAAAEDALRGGDPELAAREADGFRNDRDATPASRAFGARLAAGALQALALQKARAGEIEQVKLGRKTELKPRPPAEAWKRLIDASDAYGQVYREDPIAHPEQMAAALAVLAAEVEYAYDNVEDARKRLDSVFERFPGAPAAVDGVGPYLLTYGAQKDTKGYAAALGRMQSMLQAQAPKAAEAARAADATPEQKAAPEKIASVLSQIGEEQKRLGYFTAAEGLEKDPAGAAASLEAFARDNPGSPDAPKALYNAAIGYDRAKEPTKALAARQLVVDKYPDSDVAPRATLALASARAAGGDHQGAEALYQRYLERWPQGGERCLALQNVGAEADLAGRHAEAARHYVTFAGDTCAKDDPDTTVKLLYRAAGLFSEARKRADERAALQKLLAVGRVTDTVAKSYVEDARRRVGKK